MNRILSWKIKSGVYAYVYPPTSESHISNRIPEDSTYWKDAIDALSAKTIYAEYISNMAHEVFIKFGINIPIEDDDITKYWGFANDNSSNIILLAGKDGENASLTNPFIDDTVFDKINNIVDEKLNETKDTLSEENAKVWNYIQEEVRTEMSSAKKELNEVKTRLESVSTNLTEKLDSASESIEKAAKLFELSEDITSDDIKNVFSFVNDNSDDIINIKTDYDNINQTISSIEDVENIGDGLFGKIATHLNIISGSVSSVSEVANAAYGISEQNAFWIDKNSDTIIEATRFINANSGIIMDKIDYIDNSLISTLESSMDAKDAEIRNIIMTETNDAITNVRSSLNAISGIVEDTIIKEDSDGSLSNLGKRMNAAESSIEEWITTSDSAMSIALDVRETWNSESGKLSTVSNLVAETDGFGNIVYYISGLTNNGEVFENRVKRTIDEESGDVIYVDDDGYRYTEDLVYTHLSPILSSYISQTSSGITLSVISGGGLVSAVEMVINENESFINLVASKVVVDAEMIAKSISSNTANIGGIVIGNGRISSSSTGVNSFSLNGNTGTLQASNASISGTVYATKGIFNGTVHAKNGSFSGSVYANDGVFSGTVYANDGSFSGSVYANDGVFNGTVHANDGSFSGSVYANDGVFNGTIHANNGSFSGSVYAESGYFKGKISSTEGDIGGISIKDNGLSGSTFVIKNGEIIAENITIDGGTIAGTKLDSGKMTFYDDSGNTVAFLGSNVIKDTKESIFLAGFNSTVNFYVFDKYNGEYVSNESKFGVISLQTVPLEDILLGNSVYMENMIVYELNDLGNGQIRISEPETFNGLNYSVYAKQIGNGKDFYYIISQEREDKYKRKIFSSENIMGPYLAKSCMNDTYLSNAADFIINSDGSVECKNAYISGGLFEGEIISSGKFKGILEDVNGKIKNSEITESLTFNSENGVNILNVNKNCAVDGSSYYTNRYSYYNQNKSKNTVYYNNEVVLYNVSFDKGRDITIGDINGYIHRFVPYYRSVSEASVMVTINYSGDSISSSSTYTFKQDGYNGKDMKKNTTDFTISGITLNNIKSLKINVKYYIPVCGKYGASYGSGNINIDPFVISFKVNSPGLTLSNNGLVYLSNNEKYGLKISNDGIGFYKNGTWYDFGSKIESLFN